jgi:4-coumarate--CoA ligase
VAEFLLPTLQTVDILEQQAKKGMPPPEQFEIRTIAHLPTAHIAGIGGYFISPPLTGTLVFWMSRYSFKPFVEYAKKHRITALYTVPSIFLSIAKSPIVTDHFDDLRMAMTGAAKMDGDLQKAANAKLGGRWKREGKGGTFIGQTWGMSETTGAVTRVTVDEVDDTGSIAPLMPNMEIRLVDEDGRDVPRGEAGEIIVYGPVVSNGYHNNDKANKETFVEEGGRRWIRTGDIVQEFDGKFYVVDRKKELIKYKGLQIPPAELEGILDSHPGILEAAVVGVPDPADSSSELPRAYIVASDKSLNENTVKEWIQGRVSPYKQLRGGVVFMDALPKNAVGKLLRRNLRDAAIKSSRSGAKL